MNAEALLANFELVANAPDGVKRLRDLVFQLAATGRLVRPIADDPTSEALLGEIAQERSKLVAAGSIKHDSPFPDVGSSSQLPAIPNNWRWILLGNLAAKIGSGSTPRGGSKVYTNAGIPFLRSQNIWNDAIRLDDVVYIDVHTHEMMRNTHVLPNDILLNITGASLGRCAIVPSEFPSANVSQHVTIIRPLFSEIGNFVRIVLLSPLGQGMIWGRQVGMAREGLSKKVLEQFEIPLPPLAEQKRIVAKVEELMALCDQLEAQQQERERRFPVLSCACHTSFAQAPTPANLNRIFNEIGTVSPVDLRKSILTLAVQGKLVPQDLKDEPAQNLVERARKEKKELIEAGKIKRAKNLGDNPTDIITLTLPPNWVVNPLDDIVVKITDGEHATPKRESKGYFLLSARNVRDGFIDVSDVDYVGYDEFDRIRERCDPDAGDVLLSCSGSVGRVAIVDADNKYAMVRSAALIKPSKANIDSGYLALALRSPILQSQIDRSSKQSAQANLFIEPIRRLIIPIPPLAEQRRIVTKVDQLMALVDHLELQQREAEKVADGFAKACVASFTGTNIERRETMKAPKTELVSVVMIGKKPEANTDAPLATLLSKQKGELPAKALWQQSGLAIDAFYQQLKSEIAQGWIAPPVGAEMKVVQEA